MTSTKNDLPEAAETTSKKGSKRKLVVVGVLIGTALVGFAIGKGSNSSVTAAPAPAPVTITKTVTEPPLPPVTVQAPAPAPVTVTVTEAPPAPVVSGPAEEISKSGVLVVGTDIKAGKWKTDGKINPARSAGYFAILADPTKPTSDVDNIVTNDNPDGQAFASLEDGQGLENNNLHWVWVG